MAKRASELDKALNDALGAPNVLLDDVPVGKDRRQCRQTHCRQVPTRPNWVKEHFEIGEALGMMDFERRQNFVGRFTVLKAAGTHGARLGQFMLDLYTTEHGYEEVSRRVVATKFFRHQSAAEIRGRSVFCPWRGRLGSSQPPVPSPTCARRSRRMKSCRRAIPR
jgi:seryl-tRNA synthetase